MTNTNCLEHIRCPACGSEGSFRIEAMTMFTVTDDGTDDYGDVHWSDDSYIECPECLCHGTVKDFVGNALTGLVSATDLPTRFDDYEVHGMKRLPSCHGQEEERVGRVIDNCEQVPDDDAEFWSLFGHIPGQGLDCIGDFKSREHAEEVYSRITGRTYGRNGGRP